MSAIDGDASGKTRPSYSPKCLVNQCNLVYLRSRKVATAGRLAGAAAGLCVLVLVAWWLFREPEVQLHIIAEHIALVHLDVQAAESATRPSKTASDSAVFGDDEFSVTVRPGHQWANLVKDGDLAPETFELLQNYRKGSLDAPWVSPSNISCLLAHAAAWRAIREATQPSIVLAPGAQLTPFARSTIQKAANELPADFSLLLLQGDDAAAAPTDMAAARFPGGSHIRPIGGRVHPCESSYLLSPVGAIHLLSNLFPIRQDLHGLLQETMDLWKHRMAATRHPAAASDWRRPQPQVAVPALHTPRILYVLCAEDAPSAAACGTQARLMRRLHVLQSHKQAAAPHAPWSLRPMTADLVHSALQSAVPGLQLTGTSQTVQALVACAAVLAQAEGGVCIPHRGGLLRDPSAYLDCDEVVIGQASGGGISAAFTAASSSAASGALGSFLRRLLTDPAALTPDGLLGVWEGLAGGGSSIMVLPAQLVDPFPVRALALEEGGGVPAASLEEYPPPALATWTGVSNSNYSLGSIPRILHFIWLGSTVPAGKLRLMRSWLGRHPGWQAMVWRDAQVAQLQSAGVVDLCDDPKQKADVARYEIMWRHGGVYVDMDFESIQSLESILHGPWPGVVCHESPPPVDQHSLSNGFFAFRRGFPAMRRAMLFALRAKRNTDFVHLMTGPRMFKLALESELPALLRLPTDAMYPVTFGGRETMRELRCHSQPCAEHFPHALALHVWSLPSDPVDRQLPAVELENAASEHNAGWGYA